MKQKFMAAEKILRHYQQGERNFTKVNIRGESFQRKNLSGANFSEADITGTNFSEADITGTNFIGANLRDVNFFRVKGGLQNRWIVGLTFTLLIVSVLLKFLPLLAGFVAASNLFYGVFDDKPIDLGNIMHIFAVLILLITVIVIYLVVIIRGLDEIALIILLILLSLGTLGWILALNLELEFLKKIATIAFTIAWTGIPILFETLFAAIFSTTFGVIFQSELAVFGGTGLGITAILTIIALNWNFVVTNYGLATIIEALLIVILGAILGTYIGWRAIKKDNRETWIKFIGVVYASFGGTNFKDADLTDANFTSATLNNFNFTDANLTRTRWYESKKLEFAKLDKSILTQPAVLNLLITGFGYGKSYQNLNLQGANLQSFNLRQANLKSANLNNANLIRSDLEEANLTQVEALETDFSHAYLTGACVDGWNIDYTTNLHDVDCRWIYLKEFETPNSHQRGEHRPSSGEFQPGDFTILFQEIFNTIDLIFLAGVDWKSFLETYRKVQVENEDVELDIQSIEKKGDAVVVKVKVPKDANKEKIQREFKQIYDENIELLKASHQEEIIGIQNQNSTNMLEIARFLASKPVISQKLIFLTITTITDTNFIPLEQYLKQELSPQDQIEIVLLTDNNLLKKLPWHLWELLEHYQDAEIAIANNYGKRVLKSIPERNKIRVLAIFGDNEGIDLTEDQTALENLSNINNVEICPLNQPNKEDCDKYLQDEMGWDLICFSGHSSTSEDGKTGYIKINKYDSLPLDELKLALEKAISSGLQLAIFNSCDGLGLAQQLGDLHIPNIIVMRELVPDKIAQIFLTNFLSTFSSGKTLYSSMRQAREKLQSLEEEYPYATWFPFLCQNPAEMPLNWHNLQQAINAKTLLKQLQEKIKQEIELTLEHKTLALNQVEILLQVGNNLDNEGMKTMSTNAIMILRGIMSQLYRGANLTLFWKDIEPVINNLFWVT